MDSNLLRSFLEHGIFKKEASKGSVYAGVVGCLLHIYYCVCQYFWKLVSIWRKYEVRHIVHCFYDIRNSCAVVFFGIVVTN